MVKSVKLNNKYVIYVIKHNMALRLNNGCSYCGKTFKRKKYRQEHLLFCRELYKSNYVQSADDEEIKDIPSPKDMYLVLRKTLVELRRVKEETKELRKFVQKTNKCVNILKWLNDTIRMDVGFESWLDTLYVDQKMLEYTFNKSYLNGVVLILLNNLPQESEQIHPIKAFKQKKNTFYIYHKKMWKIMDQTLFDRMLFRVTKLLFQQFGVWQDKHAERLKHDDRFFEDVYQTNLQQLLGNTGKGNQNEIYKKNIRSQLYQYLQQSLESVTHYKFTF